MIVDERMIAYIRSLDRGETPLIADIAKQALADRVPIIRQETASLLKVLLKMTKPKKILEVGTAVGFSALLMSEYAPQASITTIEKFEQRIIQAKENFAKAGKQSVITLLEGDAAQILKTLDSEYDFIFMDAAKGQYIHFLPEVMRLLMSGGTLVSDNVLQDGDVVESRFAVTRRNRTIHSRMREYLWELKHRPDLETVVLPIGDGVTVSTKTI
ncbi:MAG TPA: O-methyltransferase [Candidatus Scybalocola faecipullorum]|nr:O-methyltransferase [Candidatus Scybalocola faecipullorum]